MSGPRKQGNVGFADAVDADESRAVVAFILFCFVLLMLDFRIVKVISKVCILFVFIAVQNYGKSFFLSLVSVSCDCSLRGDKADDGFIQKCL